MVFTSIIFIFVFFPLFLICYYISLALAKKNMFAKLRLPDICLTLLSVAFVAWVGLNGVCAFVYLIVAVYAFGKIVEICKQRSKLWGKITVLFGILLILTGLYIFKYATYASEVLNQKFGISLSGSPTWTFLGISFVSAKYSCGFPNS